jgi:hypothetical protein
MNLPADDPPLLPARFRVTAEEAPAPADRKVVDEALETFNDRFIPGRSERIAVFVRDDEDKILAGLDAVLLANWRSSTISGSMKACAAGASGAI